MNSSESPADWPVSGPPDESKPAEPPAPGTPAPGAPAGGPTAGAPAAPRAPAPTPPPAPADTGFDLDFIPPGLTPRPVAADSAGVGPQSGHPPALPREIAPPVSPAEGRGLTI